MDMIGRIRRLHSRGKKSEREIARMTGLSRNTVAKWLHVEVDGPPKYRRGEMPGKLKAFEEAVKLALKADARRPKHERRTARALYAEIRAAGYDGDYSRVTDFVRAWRQGEGAGVVARVWDCPSSRGSRSSWAGRSVPAARRGSVRASGFGCRRSD